VFCVDMACRHDPVSKTSDTNVVYSQSMADGFEHRWGLLSITCVTTGYAQHSDLAYTLGHRP
jgi:hypothetical protein